MHVRDTKDRAEAWLLICGVTTVFPTESLVLDFIRELEVGTATSATSWLLHRSLVPVQNGGQLNREIEIIERGVIIDVDYSARNEHNSGIQRVVRNTVNHWARDHEVTLVAWGDQMQMWRSLGPDEYARVTDWAAERTESDAADNHRLVLPWRSRIILIEVPSAADNCLPLAAMASLSGSQVAMVGYDTIPIASAETLPMGMSDHFAKYMAIMKHATIVAGISQTAADEFAGFAAMLEAQGLSGPRVVACSLPAEVPVHVTTTSEGRPLVLCVGSKEPRKNHVAVLAAAEQLWREGYDFELLFIGTYGWDVKSFNRWLMRLRKAGRPVSAPRRVGDGDLWAAYARSRFTVFPSFHEGFGLPVAESLAFGTPAITSNYGSMAEIAAGGGCILIDPHDDDALLEAMRNLLSDDALIARLAADAIARAPRGWSDYAAELWAELVER
jgi:glycosyltransferase involved in cell wall biosynthesis